MAQSISQEAIGATGLPGATAATRYAGATASGAPTTGTFAVGDYVVDQTGAMYVCTVAGTPGTWQLSGVSVNENIAGKNFVINGGMDIWQRGTSFSIATGVLTYTADRWCSYPGVSTWTVSQLAPATITAISSTSTTWTFTVANNFQAGQLVIISGCTPTGYNGTWTIATASSTQFTVTNSSNPGTGTVFGTATTVAQGFKNAMRVQRNSGTTSTAGFAFTQSLETQNSLPLAGKTVTLSFWARASSSISSNSLSAYITYGQGTDQNTIYGFTNQANFNQTFTTTSGWALYTLSNYTLPTNITQVGLYFFYTPAGTAGSADYFDITGVQLEIAPQATPFSRAGGSIGGELALCQRYYQYYAQYNGPGYGETTNLFYMSVQLPVVLRTQPAVNNAYDSSGILANGSLYNTTASTATVPYSWFNGSNLVVGVTTNAQISHWTTAWGRILQLSLNSEL